MRSTPRSEEISSQGMERKGNTFVVLLATEAEAGKAVVRTEIKQLYAQQLVAFGAPYEKRLRSQGGQLQTAKQTIEIA
ncbi:MAG: hypothetical protein F6K00_33370 [Leptolyngbya sp. SIOISBB]|nr:hypothetical protein [Leptolyngbya sp. SIOISBB]